MIHLASEEYRLIRITEEKALLIHTVKKKKGLDSYNWRDLGSICTCKNLIKEDYSRSEIRDLMPCTIVLKNK